MEEKNHGYGLRVPGRDNLVDRNVSAKPNRDTKGLTKDSVFENQRGQTCQCHSGQVRDLSLNSLHYRSTPRPQARRRERAISRFVPIGFQKVKTATWSASASSFSSAACCSALASVGERDGIGVDFVQDEMQTDIIHSRSWATRIMNTSRLTWFSTLLLMVIAFDDHCTVFCGRH
jgi:hypothetical protein